MARRAAAQELHVVFFPLMAPGHLLPIADAAILFAGRGVRCTILTTPSNATLVRRSLDRACVSGTLPVGLHLIHFPAAEAGLPDGLDSLTSVTSPEMSAKFFSALEALRDPFERLLRETRPAAAFTDMYLPWTAEVARRVGVPRLVFHSMGFFPLCVLDGLDRHAEDVRAAVAAGEHRVVVQGLPHRIELRRSQLHDSALADNPFGEFMARIWESERGSYGALVNSFYELEPEYADHYRNTMGRKAWHVGPVSLCNRVDRMGTAAAMEDEYYSPDDAAAAPRAVNAADQERWLTWLDAREPGSVIYVSFGSLCRMAAAQLREIALGLEDSGHPFVWVVRDDGGADEARRRTWLPEGFQERIMARDGGGRGLVMWGWAPQVAILGHPAVGGFVTHCGWNSLLEAVSDGVPMVTWPLFAEQFYNERLVVDVLGVGVSAGAAEWGMREEEKAVVGKEKLAAAVGRVMGGGEEADGFRRRAAELKEKARRAVEEGGSSCDEVGRLIEELAAIKAAGPNSCSDTTEAVHVRRRFVTGTSNAAFYESL